MTAIKMCNQTVTPKWLQTKKEALIYQASYFINQCGRWDLNPHVRNEHKILSLARLPVPTLPHIISRRLDNNIKMHEGCQQLFEF